MIPTSPASIWEAERLFMSERESPIVTAPLERRARWEWARPQHLFGPLLVVLVLHLIVGLALIKGTKIELLLSLSAWGVMLGSIIALGAIGLTLVYGVLKFGNFSHGDIMSVGAYLVFLLMPFLPWGSALAPFSFGWEFVMALLVAMPLTGLVAYATDRILYRPLRHRKSSAVILAMASLGAAFLVRSILYLAAGADFRFYYLGRARPAIGLLETLHIKDLLRGLGITPPAWDIAVRPDQLFILGLAIFLVVLIYLLLEKTKMGKAMRATADNPALAKISGINTDRVILWTWMVGGALAGAGGALLGLDAQLRPEMGWFLLLPMFAAVILGGIGNPYGALAGGLLIGVVQQVSSAFLNPAYGPAVAFTIMILVLLFRPQGLFSRPGG
jgi:branched-chain amino acid transport system permease protein/neutral amino acid transport system permease protein